MLNLSIETDNAAFGDGNGVHEVGRILREVAERIENGTAEGNARDYNGNVVAKFSLVVTAEDS